MVKRQKYRRSIDVEAFFNEEHNAYEVSYAGGLSDMIHREDFERDYYLIKKKRSR